jgi:hypothetical protein
LLLRRVKIISNTLTILEEFLMKSLFHETKISTVDMKVLEYSNFNKKIGNEENLQAP